LNGSDTFIDVGCGKGRVVCLAARHRIKRAVGIEYSSVRAQIARRNIAQLRGRKSPAAIRCQSAEEADYSDATVLYFFNPFEASLLDTVLHKVQSDCRGRAIRVAFVMESEAQRSVFSRHDWLACGERFVDDDGHVVALYNT